ncbi:hypothetical protein X975_09021, partial [Stegodyphus mimosarum]
MFYVSVIFISYALYLRNMFNNSLCSFSPMTTYMRRSGTKYRQKDENQNFVLMLYATETNVKAK